MTNNKQIDQFKKEILVSLVEQIPFCKTLGIKLDYLGNEITSHLPFKKNFIGNPAIPALHGGVIGSFLEITAIIQLSWVISLKKWENEKKFKNEFLKVENSILHAIPKTIDITIDYLNYGNPIESFARAKVNKIGRRYASVSVETWQHDPGTPFAMASGHFLVKNTNLAKMT